MAEHTTISWCDSTFNPFIGCTKISPACDHCYAERLMDHRMHRVQWGPGKPRVRTSAASWKLPLAWKRSAWQFIQCDACGRRGPAMVSNGATRCRSCDSADVQPARRRVFCASLADVFDNEVPAEWRADLFRLIRNTPNLDWLILTKRVGNAGRMIAEAVEKLPPDSQCGTGQWTHSPITQWPWPNVWIGATVCNQTEADRDVPKLLEIPAARRFLSIEPMLGPIDLERPRPGPDLDQGGGRMICQPWLIQSGIDWVVCGGESGPHARPMHPEWVRSLRDQCAAAGVPLHFKQWGEWAPERVTGARDSFRWPIEPDEPAGGIWSYRVGTKAAGRLLDGRTHDGFPA